jgi:hypothetical protein
MFSTPFCTTPSLKPTWWASKAPLEYLTWAETITPYVDPTEEIQSVSASIAPSGSGEMTATAISIFGQTLSLTLQGGQPRRVYVVQFVVTMTSGAVYQLTVNIGVRAVLPTDQPQIPPVPGFGTAITWSTGGVVNVASGLVATGTNQATALPLPALTSIFSEVPAGAGGILVATSNGNLVVVNTTASLLAIYPNVGAQINALGVDQPFYVNPGARIVFSTQDYTTQWTAA